MMTLYEILHTLMPPEQDEALAQFVKKNLPEFKAKLELNPVKNRSGSICNSDAFWLWAMTQSIGPTLVVECGSCRGFSTWFLWTARSSEDMRIFSFDPRLEPTLSLPYHTHIKDDWFDYLPTLAGYIDRPLGPKAALAFFDDHQDHEIRLEQAALVGIRHLLFHDNYLTPYHSHMPIRFVDLVGKADFCFEFPPLLAEHDPIFAGGARRWLTYVRLLDRKPDES